MKASTQIFIKKPVLFSFKECMWFLDRGYDDCLHTIKNQTIIKPVSLSGKQWLLKISEQDANLTINVLTGALDEQEKGQITSYLSDWFDLERDLRPFYELLKSQGHLNYMPEKYPGLRLLGIPDLFEALCWCVIGQQINLNFAHRLKRRMVEQYGKVMQHNTASHYLFPKAGILAQVERKDLLDLQFSRQKADYIIGIAQEFAAEKISKEQLAALPDKKERCHRLLQLHGVGEWTANYVLMKTMRDMACIPYGDAGLHKALRNYLSFGKRPQDEQLKEFFAPFSGWEAYLVFYLWRSLS